MTVEHAHTPYGGVDAYPCAKLGKCQCGVDMVQYLAQEGTKPNWSGWDVTSITDPCLSCGGYNTPSCCEIEETNWEAEFQKVQAEKAQLIKILKEQGKL